MRRNIVVGITSENDQIDDFNWTNQTQSLTGFIF